MDKTKENAHTDNKIYWSCDEIPTALEFSQTSTMFCRYLKKNFLNFITNCLKFTNTFAIVYFNSKLEASIPSGVRKTHIRQVTCTRRLNQHPLNTVGSSVTSAKLVALILQLSPSRRGGARYGGAPSGQLQQRAALWPAQLFECRKCYATQLYCMILVDWLWPPHVIGQAIVFLPVISSSFFSSPNLIGCRLDVYHTSTHGVALVQI